MQAHDETMTEEVALRWIQTLGIPACIVLVGIAGLWKFFRWMKPWAERLMQGHLDFLASAKLCGEKNTECLQRNTQCLEDQTETMRRIEQHIGRQSESTAKIEASAGEQSAVLRSLQHMIGQRA